MKTGGGRPDIPPLTSIEEDVVSILGEERVFGLPSGLHTMGSKVRKNEWVTSRSCVLYVDRQFSLKSVINKSKNKPKKITNYIYMYSGLPSGLHTMGSKVRMKLNQYLDTCIF
jgi:hypothetical protein